MDRFSLLSPQAFSQFYDRTYLFVFRYIYGLHGGPVQDVEDLTADTFIRAFKARKRFVGSETAATGWILKIARNLVIDAQRKENTRGFTEDIDKLFLSASDTSPEEYALHREQTQILWELMGTLKIEHREMLTLRYFLGWRVKDIGEQLNIPQNTVSQNIRRVIKNLQKKWPT